MARNILFVMFDQLRFDYLACAGHPHIETPNIDRLAARSVRFSRTYVQSPVCGSSRMSFYTGRYASSHGAQWNNMPLKVGEQTIGDHLRSLGMESWLVGKTHMKADAAGMARLGLEPDSVIGARVAECGFDVWLRDDGLWAEGPDGFYDERRSPYNEYLRSLGHAEHNPWHDHANAGVADGDVASGFFMENARLPANIADEHSETPWLTREVMRFMESRDDTPWLCHASYIKPHWPYIVPAPWHDMYGDEHVPPAVRDEAELADPHPVYRAFTQNRVGQAFSRDEVRRAVIPAYMGLISQADAAIGTLVDHMEETGRMEDTMIVLTSDHGDYLGDHWLGEKGFLHDPSVRVPLIVYDPCGEADATRGTVVDAPVEAIDLAATFVEFAGGRMRDRLDHVIEGRSLLPWLHGGLRGETPEWRDYAVSEYDYSATPMASALGLRPRDARLFMIADERWKFIHAEGVDPKTGEAFPPLLFDLADDPQELVDLGRSGRHGDIIETMYERLGKWGRRLSQRTTRSEEEIDAMRVRSGRRGVVLGVHSPDEIDPELTQAYRGKAPVRPSSS